MLFITFLKQLIKFINHDIYTLMVNIEKEELMRALNKCNYIFIFDISIKNLQKI